ncbi:hypothetical protein [Rhodopirellula halodulae]|uniref:hypothetical protein n=1 Tax=Rhodopirellula halodulae TaxID=2894198 RepID=UPI001E5952ED|nr:hypothetical protein [Rhodopirellula sp. JC737]
MSWSRSFGSALALSVFCVGCDTSEPIKVDLVESDIRAMDEAAGIHANGDPIELGSVFQADADPISDTDPISIENDAP